MRISLFIITIIILKLSLSCKAQLSFEKIYNIHTWTIGTDILEVDSSNLICVGVDSKYRIQSDIVTGIIFKLNSQGDTLKKVFIGWKDTVNYSAWGDFSYLRLQNIHRTSDNNLFVTGTFAPKNPISIYESGILIMKMDQNLDTIWTRTKYILNSQTYVWWTCPTADDGFAITGKRVYNSPLRGCTYILRVDSVGNILYEKEYLPDTQFYRMQAQGICQTDDGGFLITGIEDDLNDYAVPFCIRTDSAGNELWRFTIPFSQRYNGAFNIVPTQDGNYVFGWNNQVRAPGAIYWMWINHLSKIDANGNFIWSKDYFSSFDCYNLVKELPDGRLAMYGWYTDTLGNGRQGMLTVCDSSGQMLSFKKYQGGGGLWSIMGGNFISDGQMVFCGDTYCCNYDSTLNATTSSLWIFKTDSLGYINAIGGVLADFTKGIQWNDVYPNPTSGFVHLDMNIQLNERYKKLMLEVYDIHSRKCMTIPLQKGRIVQELDLTPFANGEYLFVLVVDDYKAAVKKVLLAH